MPLDLDPLEQRLVGVLIEKEATVPESYPLTVNALVVGANQKNNRDPQMDVQDYQVEGALKSLLLKGWAIEHDKDGGRVRRYAHNAEQQLGVGKTELALLAELMLRGPQAAPELGRRAERMCVQGSPEAVEGRLQGLAGRPTPYVRLLERRPGERLPRWKHLLGVRSGVAEIATAPASPTAPAVGASTPTPAAPPAPRTSAAPAAVHDLALEVERLRERVDLLERRLDRLEAR